MTDTEGNITALQRKFTSHKATVGLFGEHVVKPGLVEEDYGRMLNKALDLRETADYKAEMDVMVYGSVARGEATRESDIDLVVVLKSNDPQVQDRLELIRDKVVFEYGYAITLDLETYESLRKLVQSGDPFIYNILEEGKVLCDHKSHFKKLRASLPKLYQR